MLETLIDNSSQICIDISPKKQNKLYVSIEKLNDEQVEEIENANIRINNDHLFTLKTL